MVTKSTSAILFALGFGFGATFGGVLSYLETNFQWEETLEDSGYKLRDFEVVPVRRR